MPPKGRDKKQKAGRKPQQLSNYRLLLDDGYYTCKLDRNQEPRESHRIVPFSNVNGQNVRLEVPSNDPAYPANIRQGGPAIPAGISSASFSSSSQGLRRAQNTPNISPSKSMSAPQDATALEEVRLLREVERLLVQEHGAQTWATFKMSPFVREKLIQKKLALLRNNPGAAHVSTQSKAEQPVPTSNTLSEPYGFNSQRNMTGVEPSVNTQSTHAQAAFIGGTGSPITVQQQASYQAEAVSTDEPEMMDFIPGSLTHRLDSRHVDMLLAIGANYLIDRLEYNRELGIHFDSAFVRNLAESSFKVNYHVEAWNTMVRAEEAVNILQSELRGTNEPLTDAQRQRGVEIFNVLQQYKPVVEASESTDFVSEQDKKLVEVTRKLYWSRIEDIRDGFVARLGKFEETFMAKHQAITDDIMSTAAKFCPGEELPDRYQYAIEMITKLQGYLHVLPGQMHLLVHYGQKEAHRAASFLNEIMEKSTKKKELDDMWADRDQVEGVIISYLTQGISQKLDGFVRIVRDFSLLADVPERPSNIQPQDMYYDLWTQAYDSLHGIIKIDSRVDRSWPSREYFHLWWSRFMATKNPMSGHGHRVRDAAAQDASNKQLVAGGKRRLQMDEVLVQAAESEKAAADGEDAAVTKAKSGIKHLSLQDNLDDVEAPPKKVLRLLEASSTEPQQTDFVVPSVTTFAPQLRVNTTFELPQVSFSIAAGRSSGANNRLMIQSATSEESRSHSTEPQSTSQSESDPAEDEAMFSP